VKSMPWLAPWATELNESNKNLKEAEISLISIVQGNDGDHDMDACKTMYVEAQTLYQNIMPIQESVSNANKAIKKNAA
ncbi:unnamed protein product, partial [Prorocentrum cordatum]